MKIGRTLILIMFLAAATLWAEDPGGEEHLTESREPAVVFADTEAMSWQPVEGVEGATWKMIRTDPISGGITALVRFEAGADEAPHHHSRGHMIHMIDGAKRVENLTAGKQFTLSEGMYLYTPAGDVHRIHYLTRCTFLFVTDGPFDMIWDKEAQTTEAKRRLQRKHPGPPAPAINPDLILSPQIQRFIE